MGRITRNNARWLERIEDKRRRVREINANKKTVVIIKCQKTFM